MILRMGKSKKKKKKKKKKGMGFLLNEILKSFLLYSLIKRLDWRVSDNKSLQEIYHHH
jgi:hypothetical protein